MSVTKEDKRDLAGREPEARRLRRELFDDEMLDRLMAATDERGVSLTGEGGFLPEMIKAVLERGMEAELTDHLGYEKGDRAGHGSGNSRNGTTPKTLGTEVGDIGLAQPRDRNSTFASALSRNHRTGWSASSTAARARREKISAIAKKRGES